jgi:hypothetical protein
VGLIEPGVLHMTPSIGTIHRGMTRVGPASPIRQRVTDSESDGVIAAARAEEAGTPIDRPHDRPGVPAGVESSGARLAAHHSLSVTPRALLPVHGCEPELPYRVLPSERSRMKKHSPESERVAAPHSEPSRVAATLSSS